jgi:hypothetical protein
MKNKNIVFVLVFGIAITALFNLMHRYFQGLDTSAGDWFNFGAAMLAVIVSLWDKVPFLSQNQQDNSKLDQITTIAEGLAAAYFYNFLQDIKALVDDPIHVQFEDQTQQTFLPDQVYIQLVIPNRLNNASIKRARDRISRKQADIISTVGRNFKINYAFENEGAKLIIQDLVKPCSAMKNYMQDYLLLHEDTEEWHFLETKALEKFRETIDSLCMRLKNFDRNKVIWKKID